MTAAEAMTTGLLWMLAVLGVWNAANMVARVACGALWWPYVWQIMLGAWAATILVLR